MIFRGPSIVNRLVSHLQRFVGKMFVDKIVEPCVFQVLQTMKDESISIRYRCAEIILHTVADVADKLPKYKTK
jgi:flagellar biosynthesis component FlhA